MYRVEIQGVGVPFFDLKVTRQLNRMGSASFRTTQPPNVGDEVRIYRRHTEIFRGFVAQVNQREGFYEVRCVDRLLLLKRKPFQVSYVDASLDDICEDIETETGVPIDYDSSVEAQTKTWDLTSDFDQWSRQDNAFAEADKLIAKEDMTPWEADDIGWYGLHDGQWGGFEHDFYQETKLIDVSTSHYERLETDTFHCHEEGDAWKFTWDSDQHHTYRAFLIAQWGETRNFRLKVKIRIYTWERAPSNNHLNSTVKAYIQVYDGSQWTTVKTVINKSFTSGIEATYDSDYIDVTYDGSGQGVRIVFEHIEYANQYGGWTIEWDFHGYAQQARVFPADGRGEVVFQPENGAGWDKVEAELSDNAKVEVYDENDNLLGTLTSSSSTLDLSSVTSNSIKLVAKLQDLGSYVDLVRVHYFVGGVDIDFNTDCLEALQTAADIFGRYMRWRGWQTLLVKKPENIGSLKDVTVLTAEWQLDQREYANKVILYYNGGMVTVQDESAIQQFGEYTRIVARKDIVDSVSAKQYAQMLLEYFMSRRRLKARLALNRFEQQEVIGYRRAITVTNNTSQVLTDYQVKVELDSSNFDFSKTDGSDVYFLDEDGNPLYYWIEKWDSANQQAIVWVKIPSIPANSSIAVYMYYGSGENLYSSFNDRTQVFLIYDDGDMVGSFVVGKRYGDEVVENGVGTYAGEQAYRLYAYNNPKQDGKSRSAFAGVWYPCNSDVGVAIRIKYYIETVYSSNSLYVEGRVGLIFKWTDDYYYGLYLRQEGKDGDDPYAYDSEWVQLNAYSELDRAEDVWFDEEFYSSDYRSGAVEKIAVFAGGGNCHYYQGKGHIYVARVIIRKYVDPEPSVVVGPEEIAPTHRAIILEPADLIYYGDEQLRILAVEYSYTQRGEEITVTAGIPEPEIPFEMQRIPRAERWATL